MVRRIVGSANATASPRSIRIANSPASPSTAPSTANSWERQSSSTPCTLRYQFAAACRNAGLPSNGVYRALSGSSTDDLATSRMNSAGYASGLPFARSITSAPDATAAATFTSMSANTFGRDDLGDRREPGLPYAIAGVVVLCGAHCGIAPLGWGYIGTGKEGTCGKDRPPALRAISRQREVACRRPAGEGLSAQRLRAVRGGSESQCCSRLASRLHISWLTNTMRE